MAKIRRVGGGLNEVLVLPNGSTVSSVRDADLAVEDGFVVRLCLDGTNRFEPVDATAKKLVAAAQKPSNEPITSAEVDA